MNLRPALALAGLVVVLSVSGGCHHKAPPPPLGIEGNGQQAVMAFPPPDTGWTDRAPLPPSTSKADLHLDEPLHVSWPTIDDKHHFEFEGDTLRLSFSAPVFDEKNAKSAPTLTITPAVKGKVTWSGTTEVEYKTESGFDADTEYTVSLPDITSAPNGKQLLGFKATFKATPIVVIAGKTIHYVPQKGRARVVTVVPAGGLVGGKQEVAILYDQAVDLGLAGKLVTMKTGKDVSVPVNVRHAADDVFDGEKVDRRFVVFARPKTPLAPGSDFSVEAKSQKPEDETTTRDLKAAQPTKLEALECSYAGTECEISGRKARAPSTTSPRLKFNNPLSVGWNDASKIVHVTPALKNMYVSTWDGLQISGSFAPSTTYAIHVDATTDQYGGAVAPLDVTWETMPLPASATLSEGVALLDEAAVKTFPITTRNADKAELRLFAIDKDDPAAFAKALKDTRAGVMPKGEPAVVGFTPSIKRDELGDTLLDLDAKLERGRAYVAEVVVTTAVSGAKVSAFPAGSDASKPARAVLFAAGPNALAAHVHQTGNRAVVDVFRLAGGEPVIGAKVSIGKAASATSANGLAILDTVAPAAGEVPVLAVSTDDASLMLPIDNGTTSRSLFPDLASGEGPPNDKVAMLITDRGVYRPGSKMMVKGILRQLQGVAIAPVPNTKVRLHVVDPLGADVATQSMITGAKGAFDTEVFFGKDGHTGRFAVKLEMDDDKHTVLTEDTVRVADFEAPKFKVDVEAIGGSAGAIASPRLQANVSGRYLFGAPMSGAHATWTIKKSKAAVKGGALGDAGLSFDKEWSWWSSDDASSSLTPITGEGDLGQDGVLKVDADVGQLAGGPTDLVLEADVTDASSRHVSGTLSAQRDPYTRHAGVKVGRRFGQTGQPLQVFLGAVDTAGKAIPGQKVTARLDKMTWQRATTKAESGASVESWKYVMSTEATCEVTTAATPVDCTLPIEKSGDYRVVTTVDDHDGGSVGYWAWKPWRQGDQADEKPVVRTQGKKIQLMTDKTKYRAGEKAHILVQSPFDKATALLTLEQGGLVHHESLAIEGASGEFVVDVTAANAPWIHASVTLLPIGATEADYRVGVVRVPVSAEESRVDVKVASAKKAYETGEEAEVTIEAKKNGAPIAGADVTLAIVDEGVLRLTSFHTKDPMKALRPGKPLDFKAVDSRAAMLKRREKAHVAGGGDSEGEDSLDTRKNFVETAAWLPRLVTDGNGRVTAKVKLPDNLTEMRMMATVIDDKGDGGKDESSFVITKPILLEPVLPRFALRGDRFDAAAMVHNNTDKPVPAKVTVAGQTREVTIAAHGRERVAVPMTADARGTKKMLFSVEALGQVRDKVELPLRVDEPGIDEHPQLSGVFTDKQEIALAVPADAVYDDGAYISLKTGSALYPELGQRLEYLLDYPHGCVEQTTSSMIPLIAARTILPWTGTNHLSDEEIKKRIEAGVERLATMRTSEGGLAYWPGGSEPNTFGSAYALHALLRAKEMGIERPRLIDGVVEYLGGQLVNGSQGGLDASIAEALALAGKLPEGATDKLFDARDKLGTFELASLAIALASLPKQEDRVKTVLDMLEGSFDEQGTPRKDHDAHDWYWWGSFDRDRAQAVIALTKLRKDSRLLPVLAGRISRGLERWTTQSTAWSLLALADFVGDRKPDGNVDATVKLEGRILDTYEKLGGDNKEIRIPLKDVAGKKMTLILTGDRDTASAFALEARWKRPLAAAGSRLARRGPAGVSIHRAYSDAKGKVLDLKHVKAGDVVRVAMRIELPSNLEEYRLSYIAMTDRIPAGFEPVNPDLDTTGSIPDMDKTHPFYDGFSSYGISASHVDLRDDKVQLYFDRAWRGSVLYATYLARATTRGTFALPPGNGELMYEPSSTGYSDAAEVTIE